MRRQLWLDCDGVLADFDAAFLMRFGHPSRDYEEKAGTDVFWEDLRAEPGFYRNLPVMDGARQLVWAVKHLRPIILTGCPRGGWAEPQKLAWAGEHFPGVPMVTCRSREKATYCQPGDVLVDDWLKYRDLWVAAGGVFVHHRELLDSLDQIASAFDPVREIAAAMGPQTSEVYPT